MKRPYSTMDGRKFETIERAIIHADKMRGSFPEYIYRNNQPCYRINPDGSGEYVSC